MDKRHLIIIATIWLFFPKVPFADTGLARSQDSFTGPLAGYVESVQQERIYFVKNREKKPSDNTAADGTEKTDEGDVKPKTSTKKKNVKKTIKQPKPFVPSETVPADQGVDFPYDI